MGEESVNDALKLSFRTEDSTIASVDSFGTIYGKKAGTTQVTVTYKDQKATCNLTVQEKPLESITKEEGDATKENPVLLNIGEPYSMEYELQPENAANKNVSFRSSNTKYATVSAAGVVKATKKGAGKTVNIIASAADGSGVTAVYKVKITKKAVKSLKVTAAKKAKAGSKVKLKTRIKAGKGAYTKVSYTCLTPKYASVSARGVVSIKKSAKKKTVKIKVMTLDGTNKKKVIRISVK